MQHFMRSYSDLLIRTCHHCGIHAMGGMAVQIPITDDLAANEAALELVRKDKLRELLAGHDGTWAAHPSLILTIVEVFCGKISKPNQIEMAKREDASGIMEEDLLERPDGARTMEGLRLSARVGIQYLAVWLAGVGSVPLYNLIEDAATVEISWVQNWKWLRHGVALEGGEAVTLELFGRVQGRGWRQ